MNVAEGQIWVSKWETDSGGNQQQREIVRKVIQCDHRYVAYRAPHSNNIMHMHLSEFTSSKATLVTDPNRYAAYNILFL